MVPDRGRSLNRGGLWHARRVTDPDPRSETREFCQAIAGEVALARGSGDARARAAALRTAVLTYPAYPDAEGTPVEGWSRELDELARELGARELQALVRGRQVILSVRAARLSAARRLLDEQAPGLAESARRMQDVGRAHFQIAEGEDVDARRLHEIAGGDDEATAIAAKLALAEIAAWDGPVQAAAAWREALAEIPGRMLDARLCALEHLLIHDVEQRGSLLRLVIEIHLGSGRGDPVLTLASRYPGLVDPSLVAEARELLAASVKPGKAKPTKATKAATGAAGEQPDIMAALFSVMGAPNDPPKVEGWGWAEKLGLAALIVCAVGLGIGVIWFRYF